MKYAIGDTFIYETMETFKIHNLDESNEKYFIYVYDDNGYLDRKIDLTRSELEDDPVWQQL